MDKEELEKPTETAKDTVHLMSVYGSYVWVYEARVNNIYELNLIFGRLIRNGPGKPVILGGGQFRHVLDSEAFYGDTRDLKCTPKEITRGISNSDGLDLISGYGGLEVDYPMMTEGKTLLYYDALTSATLSDALQVYHNRIKEMIDDGKK